MLVWFALINTKPTDEHSVYNKLIKIDEIEYVHPLFGEWDLIIKIAGESEMQLEKFMMDKISTLDGILAIKTLSGTIRNH